jgi:hypothetical protein
MDVAPDFDEFIGLLTARGVEFVIVGAYALAFHGVPRFTGDLDLLVRPTLDNAVSKDRLAFEPFAFWAGTRSCVTSAPPVVRGISPTSTRSSQAASRLFKQGSYSRHLHDGSAPVSVDIRRAGAILLVEDVCSPTRRSTGSSATHDSVSNELDN